MDRTFASQLAKLCPTASKKIIAGIVDNAHLLDAAGINTPIRVRHFFARVCVETGGLRALEEDLNYSAERMRQVWPTRFKTVAAAKPFEHNPQKLAEKVYGGRLGNSSAGDGWRFRGSGLLQNTGRENFAEVETATGLPVVANPDVLRSFPGALQAATIYWSKRKINAMADKNNTTGVCKAVNGGTTGLADQKAWLAKAAKVWPDGSQIVFPASPAAPSPPVAKPAPAPAAPIEQAPPAVEKETIERVQQQLKELGYTEVGGIDGKIGTMTATAIRAFRAEVGLPEGDGIDDALLLALQKAKPRVLAPARTDAAPDVVREKVPEVRTNWLTKVGAFFASIAALIGSFFDGILGNLDQASGVMQPVKDAAGDVPGWVWMLAIAGVAGGLFLVARHGEKKGVEAFQSGARR
ncbi:peptidoglycan-binding protein [Mesorhizobium sp. M1307]|uniref:peptidoglycan-binding protein n=1 Tax=Mesorhizobium sp. M1307 TaxID=2957079 RepID=UPI0033394FA4